MVGSLFVAPQATQTVTNPAPAEVSPAVVTAVDPSPAVTATTQDMLMTTAEVMDDMPEAPEGTPQITQVNNLSGNTAAVSFTDQVGTNGDDILQSGLENSQLTGRGGADVFNVSAASKLTTITDFNPAEDTLNFSTKSGEYVALETPEGLFLTDTSTDLIKLAATEDMSDLAGVVLINTSKADLTSKPGAFVTDAVEVDEIVAISRMAAEAEPEVMAALIAKGEAMDAAEQEMLPTAVVDEAAQTAVVETTSEATPTDMTTTTTLTADNVMETFGLTPDVPMATVDINDAVAMANIIKAEMPAATQGTVTSSSIDNTMQRIKMGDASNNQLAASDNGNVIFGMEGNDTLNGGNGGDIFFAGAGTNTMNGGAGKDLFMLRDGDNTLTLGADKDYIAVSASGVTGSNVVTDFDITQDKLHVLSNQAYTLIETVSGTTMDFGTGNITFTGVSEQDLASVLAAPASS